MAPCYSAQFYNTNTLAGPPVLVVYCLRQTMCNRPGAGFIAHEPCMASTNFEFVCPRWSIHSKGFYRPPQLLKQKVHWLCPSLCFCLINTFCIPPWGYTGHWIQWEDERQFWQEVEEANCSPLYHAAETSGAQVPLWAIWALSGNYPQSGVCKDSFVAGSDLGETGS